MTHFGGKKPQLVNGNPAAAVVKMFFDTIYLSKLIFRKKK